MISKILPLISLLFLISCGSIEEEYIVPEKIQTDRDKSCSVLFYEYQAMEAQTEEFRQKLTPSSNAMQSSIENLRESFTQSLFGRSTNNFQEAYEASQRRTLYLRRLLQEKNCPMLDFGKDELPPIPQSNIIKPISVDDSAFEEKSSQDMSIEESEINEELENNISEEGKSLIDAPASTISFTAEEGNLVIKKKSEIEKNQDEESQAEKIDAVPSNAPVNIKPEE